MKALFTLLCAIALGVLSTGCATGPRYSALHAGEAPLAAGQGRIYIYRTSPLGAAVQPDVNLNDQKVGTAVPGGYFYVDRPAGDYKITAKTEVARSLSLTLDPAQKRYVRLNISMGFFVGHVWPELRDNEVAEKEIIDCLYIGK